MTNHYRYPISFIAIVGIAITSHADVFFEDTDIPDVFEEQDSLFGSYLLAFDETEEIVDSADTLSIDRYGFYGARSFEIGESRLNIGALYERSRYTGNLIGALNVDTLSANFRYTRMISDNWAGFGTGWVGSSGASSTSFSDGLFGGAGIGIQGEWSNGLSFGFGVFGSAHGLEQSAELAVVPSVKWRINDRARLRLGTDTGLLFTYDVTGNRRTFIEVGIQGDGRRFRLDDYYVDEFKDLAVEESAPALVFKLHHLFKNGMTMSLFGGYVGDRSIEFYHNNAIVGEAEMNGTPFIGLTFGFRF